MSDRFKIKLSYCKKIDRTLKDCQVPSVYDWNNVVNMYYIQNKYKQGNNKYMCRYSELFATK